jgi:hypothetical protein
MKKEHLQQIVKTYADYMGLNAPGEISSFLRRHFVEYETELRHALQLYIDKKTNPLAERSNLHHLLKFPDVNPSYDLFEFQAFATLADQPEGLESGYFKEMFPSVENFVDFVEQLKHNMCHVVDQYGHGSLQVAITETIRDHDHQKLIEEEQYYCCLQEDEDLCEMTCGCRMVREGDAVFLLQCETHEAVNEVAKKLHNN